jgi:CDP-glucose 4,6-dehydratase
VIDRNFWAGRRVFLTGHTGFKGAWTSMILSCLGAKVYGFALPPEHDECLFQVAGIERDVNHCIGDIRDLSGLSAALETAKPSVVLHMAAQSLVRPSYAEPVATYATNVMGTVHLLEAVRQVPEVQAVLVVTSDKCYENKGWVWGYRESDRLGGHDPYSNSKACAELVVDSYRRSFFGTEGAPKIATARAGNVIGGGDWSRDRLVPDAIRAFIAGETIRLRNPKAVRPWQHVVDPVAAYLTLLEKMVVDGDQYAGEWNFGPIAASDVPVETVVERLIHYWGPGPRWEIDAGVHPHEAAYLKLDCSKATTRLKWHPLIDMDGAIRLTAEWYRSFAAGADMRSLTLAQVKETLDIGRSGIAGLERS